MTIPAALPAGVSRPAFMAWRDRADLALETLCVLLMLGAAAVAGLQVFCRYGLNASLPWPEEVAIWLFCWAVFLGMALITGRRSHIAISFSDSQPRQAICRRMRSQMVRAAISAAASARIASWLIPAISRSA